MSAFAFHRGGSAADADDRIHYDQRTGHLWFDADGRGGIGQVLVADLRGAALSA